MCTNKTIRQLAAAGALWLAVCVGLPLDIYAARDGGGGGGGGGGGRAAGGGGGGGGGGAAARSSAPARMESRAAAAPRMESAPRMETRAAPRQSAPSIERSAPRMEIPQSINRAPERANNRASDNSSFNTTRNIARQNDSMPSESRAPVVQRQRTVESAGVDSGYQPQVNVSPRREVVNSPRSEISVTRQEPVRPKVVEVAPRAAERSAEVSAPKIARSEVNVDRKAEINTKITSDIRVERPNTAKNETRTTARAETNTVKTESVNTRTEREKTDPVRVSSSDLTVKPDRVRAGEKENRTADNDRQTERNRTTERAVDRTTERAAAEKSGEKVTGDTRTAPRERDRDVATADRDQDTERVRADRDRADRTTDRTVTRTETTGKTTTETAVRREVNEKRANLAGSERISTRASDDFNKRLVSASETTRVRKTTNITNNVTKNTTRLVVKGDNNVIVQGDVNVKRPRPYIAPRLYRRDLAYHHRNSWHNHGTYFSFGWSSSSCGSVIWAPYHSYWDPYDSYYGFSYYYPSYHRKFVFVSVGGYWPSYYRYRRYYWYGCHPGYWYGSYVVQDPPVYNTYNTYNNYYTTTPTTGTVTNVYDNPPLTQSSDVVDVIDAPNDENIVDIAFANGVKVFSDGNYPEAIERFRRAVQMDPEDVILPFTYSQALFANGEYALAASVLRGAIQNIPDDELTVYYPRGLYEDEAVLTEQIQRLESAAAGEPFAADYQLLLGYQYLGLGDLQKARGPLTEAQKDSANQLAAMKLLELADRLEAEQAAGAEETTEVE